MKDPAFLFYSQDFYSGTRLMIPNERACYIDLLIYQHQNEFVPNDLDRVLMFCSGVDKATLKATLETKFERSDKGWYNKRLKNVIDERKVFKNKLSESGTIGQFWKKCKALTTVNEYKKLRGLYYSETKENMFIIISKLDLKSKGWLQGWLKRTLKHIEDEIEIEDIIKKEDVKYFREFAHLKITEEENKKILDLGYTQVHINSIYDDIENYNKNKNYKSLFLTAKNWIKKDFKKADNKNKKQPEQSDFSTPDFGWDKN